MHKVAALMMVAAVATVAVRGEPPLRRGLQSSGKDRGGLRRREQRPSSFESVVGELSTDVLRPPPPPAQFEALSADLGEPAAQHPPSHFLASERHDANHELSVGHSLKYEVPAPQYRRDRARSDALDTQSNYEFSYQVLDEQSGNEFGHQESRKDEAARGSYHVLLPDGRHQVVEYEADERGYRPVVHYEDSNRGGFPGARKAFSG